MESNIHESTKHGYYLNLTRLVKFFYRKMKSKNCDAGYKLLHVRLHAAMDAVPEGKGYDKRLSDVIMQHLQMSDENYHPIFCEGITVEIFLTHLLLLNSHGAANMEREYKEATSAKKKTKVPKTSNEIVHVGTEKKPVSLEFLKSYGGHCSALTYYFTRCNYVPPKTWQDKLSQAMKGLNNDLARVRAASGKNLVRVNLPCRLICIGKFVSG
jgi:hypothetical protein